MSKKQKKGRPKSKSPRAAAKPMFTAERKTMLFVFLFLSVVTFLSFYPSLQNGFTNWDDEIYVHKNELIYKLSWENVKQIFNPENAVSANYHPVTVLSLAINYNFGQLNPYGYHLVNLLFHIFNSCLVFFFLYFFTRKQLIWALVPAVIFAIHPMHVEPVAWVSSRKDMLMGFFFLLGLISYLRYQRQRVKAWLGLSFVLFIVACLSKPPSVVFPLVLLLMDFWEDRKDYTLAAVEKIPFFVVSLLVGLLALQSQAEGGAIAKEDVFTLAQRLMFACYGFVMYIAKLFAPINLSTFYPYPSLDDAGNLPIIFYVAPFIVLILAVLTILSLKKTKLVFFGMAFYVVTLILVLQFLSVGQVVMSERYTYLPYIGLGFILGGGLNYLWIKYSTVNKIKYAIISLGALSTLAMGYLTFQQSKVWENSETLWTKVIELYEYRVDDSYKNRGNYRAANGRIQEALADFEIAIQLAPKDAGLLESLANTYASQGQVEKALPYFEKAIAMNPNKASIYFNRGVAMAQIKRFDQSIADFSKAESLGQSLLSILPNRAYVYMEIGQYQRSIADYNALIQKRPKELSFYQNRGQAYFRSNDYARAINDFKTVLSANPKNGNAAFNISICHNRLGQKAAALDFARKAQGLGFQVPATYMQDLE